MIRTLEEQRLARVAAVSTEAAEALRARLDEARALLDRLGELVDEIELAGDVGPSRVLAGPLDRGPAPLQKNVGPERAGAAGTRMLVMELAVGGFDRADVRERLLREYDVELPEELLDDIYGRDG